MALFPCSRAESFTNNLVRPCGRTCLPSTATIQRPPPGAGLPTSTTTTRTSRSAWTAGPSPLDTACRAVERPACGRSARPTAPPWRVPPRPDVRLYEKRASGAGVLHVFASDTTRYILMNYQPEVSPRLHSRHEPATRCTRPTRTRPIRTNTPATRSSSPRWRAPSRALLTSAPAGERESPRSGLLPEPGDRLGIRATVERPTMFAAFETFSTALTEPASPLTLDAFKAESRSCSKRTSSRTSCLTTAGPECLSHSALLPGFLRVQVPTGMAAAVAWRSGRGGREAGAGPVPAFLMRRLLRRNPLYLLRDAGVDRETPGAVPTLGGSGIWWTS